MGRPITAILMTTGLCAIIAAAVKNLVPGFIGLAAASALAFLIAGALLWASDRRYALGFARNLALAFPQFAAFIGLPSMEKQSR